MGKFKDYWKEEFIKDYNRINPKPTSCKEYCKKRGNNLPEWRTIAHPYGIANWTDWLSFCEILTPKYPKPIVISRYVPSLELLKELSNYE